ncbi:glycosyltransferase family 2 protein [Baekduia alba]|uniref:glycosyltransferase family 2 protein n=1 Tax=Baekduia alba TaxID=2997333 RepID=UPI002340E8BE|nr:glycosyltransferase family 2 protein [Baekduia alba]
MVDAVIVSYNSADTLRACVQPLAGMDHVAVCVVDNDSPEESLGVVADLDVLAVRSGRNGGFSFGCNLGAAQGQAPYILLVNPDAVLAQADLDRMVAVLDAEPDVGLVGPKLIDGDGTLMPSIRRFPRVVSTWAQALYLHRVLPRARWTDEINRRFEEYDRVGYPEWVSGACMLMRRSVLAEIGGMDEGFFLYCEDTDLCARIRARGHRIRYEPTAVAYHQGGASAPRTGLFPVLATSRVRYAAKHDGPWAARAQRLGIAAGHLTHAAINVAQPAKRRGHLAALRAALTRP